MAAANEQLFIDLSANLEPKHFNKPEEAALRLTWQTMLQSHALTGAFTFESLTAHLREHLQNSLGEDAFISNEMLEILMRNDNEGLFYAIAYPDIPINEPNLRLARHYMQRLQMERIVVNQLRLRLNPANPGVPVVDDFIRDMHDTIGRISISNVVPEVDMAPVFGTPIKPAAEFNLTGMPLFDARFRGQRVGDVNGILGGTGSGKTTFALDMGTCMAKQSWATSLLTGEPPQPVFFFSAEEPAEKLRARQWANFFRISRAFLEGAVTWDDFSTPGNLKPYEIADQRDQLRQLSERERYEMWREQFSQTFVTFDISGSAAYPEAGFGFIPEIRSYVDRAVAARGGVYPKAIFLDYAGLLVERHIDKKTRQEENALEYGLKRFADIFRNQITEPYRSTGWLLQQLTGASSGYSATRNLTFDDCGGCKAFGTNMAVCAIIGKPDQRTGCRLIHFPKNRYVENVPKAVVRIHSEYASIVDVTNSFTVDANTSQFIPRSEMGVIYMPPVALPDVAAGA